MLEGRDEERARIAAVLAALDAGASVDPPALLLRGEAGIGTSSLLDDAVAAVGDGVRVLRAAGLHAESGMPLAAVEVLLHPLGGAPLGSEGAGTSRAAVALLREAAAEGGLLCVLDDAEALDPASAALLVFAARRLAGERVALLLAGRDGGPDVLHALPELRVGGLSVKAARALLARGPATAPAVEDAVIATARGNPLALRELVRALDPAARAGHAPVPDPLPAGPLLRRVLLAPLASAGDRVRDVLLLVAFDATLALPTVRRAAAAVGIGDDEADACVDALERGGLVATDGVRVDLRDALLRAAVREDASLLERRRTHLALAEAVDEEEDADLRAWHRAAAARGPDPALADELEATLPLARARIGEAAVGAALERAASLTTDPEVRSRRLVAAAEAFRLGGRADRIASLLTEADALPGGPSRRATAAMLRGSAQLDGGRPAEAFAVLLDGAAEAAATDPVQALEMLVRAAEASWLSGHIDWVGQLGDLAARVTSGGRDDEAFMVALLVGVGEVIRDGPGHGSEALHRALALAEGLERPRHLSAACVAAVWLGDIPAGLACAIRAVDRLRASGARGDLPFALQMRSSFEAWEGRLAQAAADAAEALAIASENHQDTISAHVLAVLARIEATQGRAEQARAHANEALAAAVSRGLVMPAAAALWALGRLELCEGRPEEALTHLLAVVSPDGTFASPMPALFAVPDLVEAAVRSDRSELARPALERFEDWQERTRSVWGAGAAARMRALLADGDEAEAHFRAALRDADAQPRLEVARTRLLFGEHLRRARRRRDARDELRAALPVLEASGAEPWAERVRTELRASGGGGASAQEAAAGMAELTPQELEVARLVAEGSTNREVAARLYMGVRTVESHLGRIYGKLGVSSRVALARHMAGDPEPTAGQVVP